jgi:hypothetical protein
MARMNPSRSRTKTLGLVLLPIFYPVGKHSSRGVHSSRTASSRLPISWKSPAAAQTLRALLYKSDKAIVLQKIGTSGHVPSVFCECLRDQCQPFLVGAIDCSMTGITEDTSSKPCLAKSLLGRISCIFPNFQSYRESLYLTRTQQS